MWTNEVIKNGAKGELVSNVQDGLNYLGYKCGKVDGMFGDATENAVKAFQKANGLAVDGVMGPVTGKTLEKVYWAKKKAEDAGAAKAAPATKGMPTKGK